MTTKPKGVMIVGRKMPDKKNSRLYQTWINMRRRCREKNRKYYFQKGIKVCDEWNSYKNFEKWAHKTGYNDFLTIDRINPKGNYEPNNCRWLSIEEQQRNRSDVHKIFFNGETHCISEWAEITGISKWTISKRLLDGWSVERALTEKTHKKNFRTKGKLLFNIKGKILGTKDVAKLLGKHQATISWMVRKLGYNEALIKIKDIICLQEVK